MRDEIQSASAFLARLLSPKWPTGDHRRPSQQLRRFTQRLEELMGEYYQTHWFPHSPVRGSGYRCIRINHRMDPIVERAAADCGLDDVRGLFPQELTLWVDPQEVSYRIGENGSICVLYQGSSSPPAFEIEGCPTPPWDARDVNFPMVPFRRF